MARDSDGTATGAAVFKTGPQPGVPREVQASFLLWLTAVGAGVVETLIRVIGSLAGGPAHRRRLAAEWLAGLLLAALAAVAAYATGGADPGSHVAALNPGYHAAFLVGTGCVLLAALIAVQLRLPEDADPR